MAKSPATAGVADSQKREIRGSGNRRATSAGDANPRRPRIVFRGWPRGDQDDREGQIVFDSSDKWHQSMPTPAPAPDKALAAEWPKTRSLVLSGSAQTLVVLEPSA
ncbi:hypothetical protein E4U42_002068 [Claviceps africana]|uniref:Uncharacterized protein n=1 Tax=Claviceps africana TaxID=83212 RepID=A0A8K0NJM5_9HYPO|nr:hypothetical protein E4U42_002068 [Claviceps africana]